jgi:hypothetical protein
MICLAYPLGPNCGLLKVIRVWWKRGDGGKLVGKSKDLGKNTKGVVEYL